MQFTIHAFKQIELGNLDVLPLHDYVDCELLTGFFVYPSSTEGEMPIQITWRYHIYYQMQHIFS